MSSILHDHRDTEAEAIEALSEKPQRWAYAEDSKRILIVEKSGAIVELPLPLQQYFDPSDVDNVTVAQGYRTVQQLDGVVAASDFVVETPPDPVDGQELEIIMGNLGGFNLSVYPHGSARLNGATGSFLLGRADNQTIRLRVVGFYVDEDVSWPLWKIISISNSTRDYRLTSDDVAAGMVTLPEGTARVLVDIDVTRPVTINLPALSTYPGNAKVEVVVGNVSFNSALGETEYPTAYLVVTADVANRMRSRKMQTTGSENTTKQFYIMGPNKTLTLGAAGVRSANTLDNSWDSAGLVPTWLAECDDEGVSDAISMLLQTGSVSIEDLIYTATQSDIDAGLGGFTIPDGKKIVLIPDYVVSVNSGGVAPDVTIVLPYQSVYGAGLDFTLIVNNSPMYWNVFNVLSASDDVLNGVMNGMFALLSQRVSVARLFPNRYVNMDPTMGWTTSWVSV